MVGNNDCKNKYAILAAEFKGIISSLNPITGTHIFKETKSITEWIRKWNKVFVTIKLTTDDQCIPTITTLNRKKAIIGLEVILSKLINGLTDISFFISLCIPKSSKGGATNAKTKCSTEWTENKYF